MKKLRLIVIALLISIFLSINVQAADVPPLPEEEGVWVIDSAEVLSDSEFNILNNKSNEIYLETGKPIVVLTIESYEEHNADGWEKWDYARFAFDEYGINDDKNQNKAILIFMSEQDRQFWTELGGGYSNEGWDSYVQEVFDYGVRPFLSEDRWFDGLLAAVEGMEQIVNQGDVTYPEWNKIADDSSPNWIIDEAGLIVDVDENDINLRINDIEKNTNCSILIVTIDGLSGKNASFIGPYQYAYGAFQNYDLNECDILWLIESEGVWSYWGVYTTMGAEYNIDWIDYMYDKEWEIYEELEFNGGEVDDFLLHEIVDYSEKAILDDGFNMEEWIEINLYIILLLPLLILLSIGMFARTIPKKIEFRKKKDMAFENIALINRAIMSNLAEDSSIRKNWNGKFSEMSDSEIKSFRRLDDRLSESDVEISLEKYDNELRMINEVYQLRTNISDYFSVILLILTMPIIVTLFIGFDESSWGMEASKITFGNFLFGIGGSIFVLAFLSPFIVLLRLLLFPQGDMKKEMSLILGIPIMHSKSFTTMGDNHQMDHYDHYNWSYRVMSSRRVSFRSSSGSTSSERASSSGGGGGGGGGGGFDSGGSGGGGGGGGDF